MRKRRKRGNVEYVVCWRYPEGTASLIDLGRTRWQIAKSKRIADTLAHIHRKAGNDAVMVCRPVGSLPKAVKAERRGKP